MLVLRLQRWADDARRRVVDERIERPEGGDLVGDTRRCHVAADELRLSASAAELLGGLLGGAIVAQVADGHARRAEAGEPERDGLADAARSPRDEHGGALEAHSP